MKVKDAYLTAYNGALLYIWARCLAGLTSHYISHPRHLCGTAAVGLRWARLGQAISSVEIVHSAVGLAGGGIAAAVIQALGRGVVLFALIPYVSTGAIPCSVTGTLVVAWALGDVFRYAFYISTILSRNIDPPYILLRARYSLFLVLYPVGMTAEWLCYYLSLEEVRNIGLHKIELPNSWNFSFDFALWNTAVLASYAYFAPYMYLYMMKQRRRKLGAPKASTATRSAATAGRAHRD